VSRLRDQPRLGLLPQPHGFEGFAALGVSQEPPWLREEYRPPSSHPEASAKVSQVSRSRSTASMKRCTSSTFSRDIAYSLSPTASRASA
jgi:hypothetical protein